MEEVAEVTFAEGLLMGLSPKNSDGDDSSTKRDSETRRIMHANLTACAELEGDRSTESGFGRRMQLAEELSK